MGVDNPRYRFLFDPFYILYISLGADSLLSLTDSLFRLERADLASANPMELESSAEQADTQGNQP